MKSRIVVTGCDQISSLGNNLLELDESVDKQKSGISSYCLDLPGADPGKIAISRANWDPGNLIAPSKVPMDRSTAMAITVSKRAFEQADIDPSDCESKSLGIYWGSGMSGANTFDLSCKALYQHQQRLRPTHVVTVMPNAPAAEIALLLGAKGICLNFACACSSSAVAIGEAMQAIRSGRIEIAVAGGSESMLTPAVIAGWQAMRVLAQPGHDPATACQPFDLNRRGFALGEGAGAVVLETESRALKRGAKILGYLSGYGLSSDGTHITSPDVSGQIRAIELALDDANLTPSEIGYINAHGTATQVGDLVEASSISRVFGEYGVLVSSTKALHGHLLGASPVIELIICLRALNNYKLPIASHLEKQDPRITLKLVDKKNSHASNLNNVLSNSFAFGGTNACLIISRLPK